MSTDDEVILEIPEEPAEEITPPPANTSSQWKNYGDHPFIVTVASLGAVIGIIASVISVWYTLNPPVKADTPAPTTAEKPEKNLNEMSSSTGMALHSVNQPRPSGTEYGRAVGIRKTHDDYVNMRVSPTMDSEIKLSVYRTDKVVLLEENLGEDAKWCKVRFRTDTGFIKCELLVLK